MNPLTNYKSFCTPAKIYLTIAVIVSAIQLFTVPIFMVFINFLFALVWTYILGWLCLPYVIMLMQALGFVSFSSFTIMTSR